MNDRPAPTSDSRLADRDGGQPADQGKQWARGVPAQGADGEPRDVRLPAGIDRRAARLLYEAIAHGDAEHKEWLREAIDAFFGGWPVPAPRGQGNKEARIAALEEEVERLKGGDPLLTPEDRRCLGQLPTFAGTEPCRQRDNCQRYTQRHTNTAAHTLTAQWMCPGRESYWQFLVPVWP